ncbi:MAG: TetR family transcriptional regulator [Paenibacillaceae bacterium]|jgi:AcrR family transcriptional regulator|nr:TetR family transcriptional regulator [Paenibacillaceae bacterium]
MTAKNRLKPDLILQAAVRMIDEEGVAALTLASLAQRLEIRPPSLYNHVAGLPDIRRLLSLHGLEELRSALLHAAFGRAGEAAIRAMAAAYLAFARAHPGLYELTLHPPGTEDAERAKAARDIVNLVIRALEAYHLDDDASIHAARALRSLLHGFASLERQGGFGLPLDKDQSFDEMMSLYLAGLHARFVGPKHPPESN